MKTVEFEWRSVTLSYAALQMCNKKLHSFFTVVTYILPFLSALQIVRKKSCLKLY